jgi:hypothetical protein
VPLEVVVGGIPEEGETLTAGILDTGPSPAPSVGTRFFRGFQWRYLFTDLNCITTTFAEGIVSQRSVLLSLGQAEVITGKVVPDDPRVNTIWDDAYPKVAPSKRIVWAFRRDGSGETLWRPRAAGILMQPEDQADANLPVSTFTAYGPRKLLAGRAVQFGAATGPFSLPGPDSPVFLDPAHPGQFMTGDQIALTVLQATINADGPCFIDAGPSYGGSSFWAGTIETTDPIGITAQAGSTVADIWQQLEDAGNCDIVLTPVYDPVNRPGITHDLSIYRIAGEDRPAAVFGWDRLNRCVANIDRMHDATPGSFFNRGVGYAGQGGAPVPAAGTLDNGDSITAFGVYWAQNFQPGMQLNDPTGAAVLKFMRQQLVLAKQGKRTMTITPIPERSPIPLLAYGLGDRVPIYASDRLRVTADGYQRVQSIPFQIDDNGIEHVTGFVASADYRTPSVSS